jgi:hypothetical protein
MRRRGLPDSVGTIGEQLAIVCFRKNRSLPKLQLAPRGTKNGDALSRKGEKFLIKPLVMGQKPEPPTIHLLSWAELVEIRFREKWMNAWYVAISARTLGVARQIYQSELISNG